MEWIDVNKRTPNDKELRSCLDFLCVVMIPQPGGGFMREHRIIGWNLLDKQWNCTGMIVTHFQELPALP